MLSTLLIMKANKTSASKHIVLCCFVKENFIFWDLQTLWLSSLETGAEISHRKS